MLCLSFCQILNSSWAAISISIDLYKDVSQFIYTKMFLLAVSLVLLFPLEWLPTLIFLGFPAGSDSKETTCHVVDLGWIPGLGRCPEEGNSYPRQCSCLENSIDRGACQTTVHEVEKSWTRLNVMTDTCFHFLQARILEWVAIPFPRGSSQSRDRTQVSCIVGAFFTIWATGKPQFLLSQSLILLFPNEETRNLYLLSVSSSSSTFFLFLLIFFKSFL